MCVCMCVCVYTVERFSRTETTMVTCPTKVDTNPLRVLEEEQFQYQMLRKKWVGWVMGTKGASKERKKEKKKKKNINE
jgi:hypothetical protein